MGLAWTWFVCLTSVSSSFTAGLISAAAMPLVQMGYVYGSVPRGVIMKSRFL